MATLDEISPTYIGEDRIGLTLADPLTPILANVPFAVNVDYTPAGPGGLVLPVELIFQSPSGSFSRRVFENTFPTGLLLTPKVRGDHLILLRECYHNHWQGRLVVTVDGEDFEAQTTERVI